MVSKVIVGVDGTLQSDDAVVLGRTLAGLANAELVLVNSYSSLFGDDAADVLAVARRHAGPAARTIAHPDSDPVRGLRDVATLEGADLIVVGSTDRGPVGRILLGSVTKGILRHSSCAVAVAPRGLAAEGVTFGSIAVGVDDDGSSERAEQLAAELADAAAARHFLLVSVVDPMSPPHAVAQPVAVVERVGHEVPRAERLLADELSRLGRDGITEVRTGRPAAELVAVSEEVDLMVLGARHRGTFARRMPGGLAEAVAGESRCPLIVCPTMSHHKEQS